MSRVAFVRHPREGGGPATLLFESDKAPDGGRCALLWSDPRLRGDDDSFFLARLA
jgi:hypothetical protein